MLLGIILVSVLSLYSMRGNPVIAAESETLPPDVVQPAKPDYAELRLVDTVVAKRVIDPLRIEMKDGRIVQLAAIDIPDLYGQEPGDIAVAATAFLRSLVEGRKLHLYQTKNATTGRVNRMNYLLGHLERADDNLWIQGVLLANGLARIYPTVRNPELSTAMLAEESRAIAAQTGLWHDATLRPRTPQNAESALNSLAIVEGTVRSVATISNRIYLNFGPDWKTDFTIGIDPPVRKKMTMGGSPLDYTSRHVRVHGWVEKVNGPYINLIAPAWLEIAPETATPADQTLDRR